MSLIILAVGNSTLISDRYSLTLQQDIECLPFIAHKLIINVTLHC